MAPAAWTRRLPSRLPFCVSAGDDLFVDANDPRRCQLKSANFNKNGDELMKVKSTCGAHARTTGAPCMAKPLPNGRCKLHGGMSTGPKTAEGRKVIADAMHQRMASGQRKRVLEGFYAWLEGGAGKCCLGLPRPAKGESVGDG